MHPTRRLSVAQRDRLLASIDYWRGQETEAFEHRFRTNPSFCSAPTKRERFCRAMGGRLRMFLSRASTPNQWSGMYQTAVQRLDAGEITWNEYREALAWLGLRTAPDEPRREAA